MTHKGLFVRQFSLFSKCHRSYCEQFIRAYVSLFILIATEFKLHLIYLPAWIMWYLLSGLVGGWFTTRSENVCLDWTFPPPLTAFAYFQCEVFAILNEPIQYYLWIGSLKRFRSKEWFAHEPVPVHAFANCDWLIKNCGCGQTNTNLYS